MSKIATALAAVCLSAGAYACPMSSAEKLVCEVVMCNPIGLAIPASHNECMRVNREFAIYLATLGPFKKPPKCKNRDQNCNVVGNASGDAAQLPPSFCDELKSEQQRESCNANR